MATATVPTQQRLQPPSLQSLRSAVSSRPELIKLTTPRLSEYTPHTPHPKQAAFLLLWQEEAFYGGAAGGGKSDALLMGALQYVDCPGYAAILFRRTYTELSRPEALLDRSQEWLAHSDARWEDRTKTWTFPSGARLCFGYLESERDKYHYQSSAYQYIAFDELTEFTETQYLYVMSRLRRLEGVDIPLRVRSASNPGGDGHEWVKQRFIIEGLAHDRPYIPALIDDNPSLDREQYKQTLAKLDPLTRERLLNGDWDVLAEGYMFKRHWFEVVEEAPAVGVQWVRFWDCGGTPMDKDNPDPDPTAGALVGRTTEGVFYIADIRREQIGAGAVEALVRQTADVDGPDVVVCMEQEPGSSGKAVIEHYRRRVLPDRAFYGIPSTGKKVVRAAPVSSHAEAGNIKLVRGPWIGKLLDEATLFPEGTHDDQVDALSGAVGLLTTAPVTRTIQLVEPVRI